VFVFPFFVSLLKLNYELPLTFASQRGEIMKKLVLALILLVAVSFATSSAISNDMLVETLIHHTPTGFVPPTSGGGAGYYFWDSNESSDYAPVYSWIDCTTGTDTGLDADDAYTTVSTPAALKYCGVSIAAGSNMYIGTNGVLGFNSDSMHWYPGYLPSTSTPNNVLCLYGDDLIFYNSDGASIYTKTATSGNDDLYIVSYHDGMHWLGTPCVLTFQAYFVENNTGCNINNTIVFQYAETSEENGGNAVVGIENAAGNAAAVYSINSDCLRPNLAIVFIDAGYVDSYIDHFDLTTPSSGSQYRDGTTVTFDWQDAAYSGSGTLTYDLILSNNANLSSPFYTGTFSASTGSYTFARGNTSDETVYWGVEANETTVGFSRASDSIWSITLHNSNYAIEETTWGQLKAAHGLAD
jgi:hypothetical protein